MMIARRALPSYAPDVQPTAGPFVIHNGKAVRRCTGFLQGKRITCPDGHVVNEPARFLEDGTLFCGDRAAQGQAQCGAILYVLVIPGRGDRRRIWVADCSRAELATIEKLGLDADGVLAYFGATFAR